VEDVLLDVETLLVEIIHCGDLFHGKNDFKSNIYKLKKTALFRVAALMNSNELVFCGGTLITKNKVVTGM